MVRNSIYLILMFFAFSSYCMIPENMPEFAEYHEAQGIDDIHNDMVALHGKMLSLQNDMNTHQKLFLLALLTNIIMGYCFYHAHNNHQIIAWITALSNILLLKILYSCWQDNNADHKQLTILEEEYEKLLAEKMRLLAQQMNR